MINPRGEIDGRLWIVVDDDGVDVSDKLILVKMVVVVDKDGKDTSTPIINKFVSQMLVKTVKYRVFPHSTYQF